jgi:hypothetical protein
MSMSLSEKPQHVDEGQTTKDEMRRAPFVVRPSSGASTAFQAASMNV